MMVKTRIGFCAGAISLAAIVLLACVSVSSAGQTCGAGAQVVLIDEEFCSGVPSGWSQSGVAHATDLCALGTPCDTCPIGASTRWVYFGEDGACEKALPQSAATGMLQSAPIDLSGLTVVTLEYCSIYNGERGLAPSGPDAAWVEVDGVIVDDASFRNQNTDAWETRTVDLSDFATNGSGPVTITWRFNTRDAVNNMELGWQIDQVVVSGETSGCPPQPTLEIGHCALGPGVDPVAAGADVGCVTSFDADFDSDVDLIDYAIWQRAPGSGSCALGPAAGSSSTVACSMTLDFDADGDVDLADYAIQQRSIAIK